MEVKKEREEKEIKTPNSHMKTVIYEKDSSNIEYREMGHSQSNNIVSV